MHRFNRDRRGVSPVVGSILMVAITVIMVAVIWVMAQNLVPNFSGAPTVDMRADNSGLLSSQIRIVIERNNLADAAIGFYKVTIFKNDTNRIMSNVHAQVGMMGTASDGTIVSFSNANAGKLTAGDAFLLTNLKSGSLYTFYLIYQSQAVGEANWNT